MTILLVQTKLFINVLGSEEADDRGPTLMSIISTLGNVLDLIDEHRYGEVFIFLKSSIPK